MVTKLAIAIPASVISDTPHLREKTAKIGQIARAAAIFRVNEIYVYPDNPQFRQDRDINFISLLLNYIETPQYLRKKLYKLDPDLQFAGILPPLRTPNHPSSGKIKDLKVGEYREGIIVSASKEGLQVDIGVDKPAILRDRQHSVDERLTLQVIKVGEPIEVQVVNRYDVPDYWGFQVFVEDRSFTRFVSERQFDLTIATSKNADPYHKVRGKIGEKWHSASSVLVAFGPPARGLNEIAREDGVRLREIADFVVNTVPLQGTATVRTEEAIMATLSIFNVDFNF
jgi:predicted SPOUT superfamily RNA methylase MTH1